MEISRLRYFCTVAETGSLHKAAELLRLSPAAISKAIRLLEEELDTKLLLPSGRGITVTAQGVRFAKRAAEILKQVDALQREVRNEQDATIPLRIASFEVFSTHFLAPLLNEYFSETPFLLHELGPGEIERSIAEGIDDIGITYIPIPHPALDFLKVSTLKMGVYISAKRETPKTIEEIPFVVPISPIEGSPTRVQGLDGWPDHLAQRKILHRVTLMESALEMTRQGAAAVYLPTFIASLHNSKVKECYQLKLVDIKLPFRPQLSEQTIYLVKRKNEEEGRTLKKMAAAIRQIVKL